MRRRLRENFPAMTERFSQRMDGTLEELRREAEVSRCGEWGDSGSMGKETEADRGGDWGRTGLFRRDGEDISGRKKAGGFGKAAGKISLGRLVPAAGSCVAAAVVCIVLFFTAFPSYAADIPILNRIIYTISPLVRETGEGEAKAAEKTAAVLKDFMESGVAMYTGQEDTGGDWQINTNTAQAAYYFRDKVMRYFLPGREKQPEVEITVRSVEARRKGYEISGTVACDVLVDGVYCFSEHIEVVLIERRDRLTVVGMQESEGQTEAEGTFAESR